MWCGSADSGHEGKSDLNLTGNPPSLGPTKFGNSLLESPRKGVSGT